MARRTHDESAAPDLHGGRVAVPRSRGATSGLLLLLLGIWGTLIPLVGPYVHFGYTPDSAWHFSNARFWLEFLPGIATIVGGFLLLVGANRISTSIGAWLAAAGGAWFLLAPTFAGLLHFGSAGNPIHTSILGRTLEQLLLFTGIGVVILFLAATAIGRLSVHSVRDVRAAQRRQARQDQRAQDEYPDRGDHVTHRERHDRSASSPEAGPVTRTDLSGRDRDSNPATDGTLDPGGTGTSSSPRHTE